MNFSYLAEFRKALKVTQEQLADKSGLSIDTISRWEREGIPGSSTADKVYYYSRALKCSIDVVVHFSNLQKEMNKR